MSDKEIAMQITLSALEHGGIKFTKTSNDSHEDCNKKCAQQICEFYKAIFETVNQQCKESD